MAIQSNKRLLLELDKHRRDINKETINAKVDDLNLEKLNPVVDMVANSRAAYIGALMKLSNSRSDTGPSIKEMDDLKEKREEFEELVAATNALEVAIERGYVDIISAKLSMGSEWTVPVFPDTDLSHISHLVLLWRGVTQSLVKSLPIIKHFDVFEESCF